jgi:maltooligosyltrehalose trehalohydrolase
MDSQWIDEFHHALRVTSGEEKSGYYADFDGIKHLAKSYKEAYVYNGQFSPHRYKKFGVPAENNPGKQFIVFSQNHDHVGNRMLGERTSQLVSFEMQKLMAGAIISSPFIPMLFMGEEYSEPHPFLYFVSHSDQDLLLAVRKGRKEEFKSFHSEGEAPDPDAEQTFHNSKLQWDLIMKDPHSIMLKYYKKLLEVRKQLSPLRHPDRKTIEVKVFESQQVLLLHRWYNKEHVLCFLNFSKEKQSISIPTIAPKLQKVIDSSEPVWKGPASSPEYIDGGSEISFQPESFLIYTGHV